MQCQVLRKLLAENNAVIAAGIYDALSARIAEQVGFKVLHLGGFAVEGSLLGRPDIGLITLTELADHVARITAASTLPMIVDVDTGFGGIHNIARTVFELERAGAAGLHIEDQITPKRCPLLDGRELIAAERAVSRIKAALDARRDADFLIIARCDADSISYEELVRRSNLYLEAGADMVLPMLLMHNGKRVDHISPDQLMDIYRLLSQDIRGPLLNVMMPQGFTVSDFREAGYAMVSIPVAAQQAAANAIYAVLTEALQNGSGESYLRAHAEFVPNPGKLMELMAINQFLDFERKHGR
jgi:2-methylisocitrate lyase-like PEP mutase family enzyme